MGSCGSSFFLESLSVGVGEDAGEWQEVFPSESLTPLRDYSLFGNNSDRSELDEISKQVPANGLNNKRTFCSLDGENLLCEAKGRAKVFCLRFTENSDVDIVAAVTHELEETPKRVKIKENDILVVVTADVSEAEVIGVVKATVDRKNPREIPVRHYSKDIAEYLKKEANAIVIAARILKGI